MNVLKTELEKNVFLKSSKGLKEEKLLELEEIEGLKEVNIVYKSILRTIRKHTFELEDLEVLKCLKEKRIKGNC